MRQNKRTVILVLGMHRSGTSAIARSLEVLGISFGENLMPPASFNSKGFWEDTVCVEINRRLLSAFNSSYHAFNFNWSARDSAKVIEDIRSEAIEYIKKQSDRYKLWAFKDPRLCRLLPFWQEVFESVGCDVRYVIALRNPKSVAESLFKRDDFSYKKTYFLWLQDMLHVINGTKHSPAVVVDYDLMIRDPQKQLSRIAKNLLLNMPSSTSAALEDYCNDFLDGQLRNTTYTAEQLEQDENAPQDVVTLYSLLSRAARDEISLDVEEAIEIVEPLAERQKAFAQLFDYSNELQEKIEVLSQKNQIWKHQAIRRYILNPLNWYKIFRV